MKNYSDFHVHPDYSIDARGSIDDYCRQALKIGLDSLCFTTHYDSDPKRANIDNFMICDGVKTPLSDETVSRYINDVRRASEQYGRFGLRVYCGIEIDYYPEVEPEAERIKSKFDFDFIMGSVHCIENLSISNKRESKNYWRSNTVETLADDYFDQLTRAARCSAFDCLGHLDYYIRFARGYYGAGVDRIVDERFDAIFEILINTGTGIEINAKPIINGGHDFHPSVSILKRAINSGVDISSVGSDCHRPEDLAVGVKEAYDFLASHNIKPIYPIDK